MGGGGFLGDITEIASLGTVKSKKTKTGIKKSKEANAERQKIINSKLSDINKEEEKRKKRILSKRQGRRSLMFKDEQGVQTERKTTLGG